MTSLPKYLALSFCRKKTARPESVINNSGDKSHFLHSQLQLPQNFCPLIWCIVLLCVMCRRMQILWSITLHTQQWGEQHKKSDHSFLLHLPPPCRRSLTCKSRMPMNWKFSFSQCTRDVHTFLHRMQTAQQCCFSCFCIHVFMRLSTLCFGLSPHKRTMRTS